MLERKELLILGVDASMSLKMTVYRNRDYDQKQVRLVDWPVPEGVLSCRSISVCLQRQKANREEPSIMREE